MHAAVAKAINAAVQPMLHNVTNCYANSPNPQIKGLTSGLDADVTSLPPKLATLSPLQTQAVDLLLT
jgi:hypothetical protein